MRTKYKNQAIDPTELKKFQLGLERESIRTTPTGKMSQLPHPLSLGSPLLHPTIKTDFSEAQIEYATSKNNSLPSLIKELKLLHAFTYKVNPSELLWPFSMPPVLPPSDSKIPLANYGTSSSAWLKTTYRKGLGHRYGRRMQTVSGIHFNISIHPTLLKNILERDKSLTTSCLYFGTIRNYSKIAHILIYLFGSSPMADRSYSKGNSNLSIFDKHTWFGEFATSLRLSPLGYVSEVQNQFPVSLNSLSEYIRDLCKMVSTPYPDFIPFEIGRKQLSANVLQLENEYYSMIRPKEPLKKNERTLEALEKRGVSYLEVRVLDVDPFSEIGVDMKTLKFLELIVLDCFLRESPNTNFNDKKIWVENQKRVSLQGRKPGLKILERGKEVSFQETAKTYVESLFYAASLLDNSNQDYTKVVQEQLRKIENPYETPSAKVIDLARKNRFSFVDLGLAIAEKQREELQNFPLTKDQETTWKNEVTQSLFLLKQMEREVLTPKMKTLPPIHLKSCNHV